MPDSTRPSQAPYHAGRWAILIACAVVGLGTVMRIWGIGERGLWLDEAFSVLYTRLSWADVIELRRSGTNPPLYHFLLSIWVSVFGDSERAVRSLSALCGVAAVAAIIPLARRLVGHGAALPAAVLLAINQTAIAYSREARFYAMTELWAILTTWALHKWVVDRSRWSGIAYLALAVLFVWLHTFAWLVLLAHGAWLLWRARCERPSTSERRRLLRGVIIGTVVPVVAFLPWVPVLLDQVDRVLDHYWIGRPTGWEPLYCLYDYLAPVRWLSMPVAGAAIVIGAVTIFRRRGQPPDSTPDVPFGLLLAWLAIPVVVPLAWSLAATPVFQIKYTIVAQPAAILLLAWLACRVPVLAMGILAAVCFWNPWIPGYPLQRESWREAAATIRDHPPSPAPIYMYRDYCWYALEYYLDAEDRIVPVTATGKPASEFLPCFGHAPVDLETVLAALRNEPGPAWMVIARVRETNGQAAYDALLEALGETRPIDRHWPLRKVDLIRFDRRAGPTSLPDAGRSSTGTKYP
jgi:hypothetical protein